MKELIEVGEVDEQGGGFGEMVSGIESDDGGGEFGTAGIGAADLMSEIEETDAGGAGEGCVHGVVEIRHGLDLG